MKLYTIADVKNKFMDKHKCTNDEIYNKVFLLRQKAEQRKAKLINNKLLKKQNKLAIFNNLMVQFNLTNNDHELTDEQILTYDSIPNLIGKISDVKNKFANIKRFCENNNIHIDNTFNLFNKLFYSECGEKEVIRLITRRNNLKQALEKYNLEIRGDSKLCQQYLDGGGVHTAEQLALIMKQMEWFINNTSYNGIMQYLFDQHRENRFDYYDRPDPHEISREAKKIAFENYIKSNERDGLLDYMISFNEK